MPHITPFFQGFSSILFGRPALSGLEKNLRKVAGFCSFHTFWRLSSAGVDALMRLNRKSNEHHMQGLVLAAMIAHRLRMRIAQRIGREVGRARLSSE